MPYDEDVKVREMRLWNAMLDDHHGYRNKPEHQHGAFRAHAAVLHRFGVIDNDELLELNDLAMRAMRMPQRSYSRVSMMTCD